MAGGGNYNHDVKPGAKFEFLTVIERLPRRPWPNGKKGYYYEVRCLCDCGNETIVHTSTIVSGIVKSCGCHQLKVNRQHAQDLRDNAKVYNAVFPGAVFGRLTVIQRLRDTDTGWTGHVVECQCECGNKTRSGIGSLIKGSTQSCGCLQSELLSLRNRTLLASHDCFSVDHQLTYLSWRHMVSRCTNENDALYPRYGRQGITVCKKLKQTPWALFKLLGDRPSKDYSIDRWPISTGSYTCGRCKECKANGWSQHVRWATPREQALNRGDFNQHLTAFGKTLTKSQWLELSGLSWSTLNGRLGRGWDVESALSTPTKLGKCYVPELNQ